MTTSPAKNIWRFPIWRRKAFAARTLPIFLAAIAACAPAQVTPSGKGFLLRVKYVKGQVLRFATTTSMTGLPGAGSANSALSISMPATMTVNSVVGTVTKATIAVGPAKYGGNVIQPVQTLQIQLDARNSTPAAGTAGSLIAPMPSKVVRIGDTWKSSAPIPGMPGTPTKATTATYTFLGTKVVDGKSVAAISYKFSGGTRGSGSVLVLVKDGTLYRNSATLILTGANGNITAKMSLHRI